jgi:hypothetical protein
MRKTLRDVINGNCLVIPDYTYRCIKCAAEVSVHIPIKPDVVTVFLNLEGLCLVCIGFSSKVQSDVEFSWIPVTLCQISWNP